MLVDLCNQSINSERFGFSIPGLHVPPSSRACSQREINHAEYRSGEARIVNKQRQRNDAKSREIFFIVAIQGLQVRISASFISLRVTIARRIGRIYGKYS